MTSKHRYLTKSRFKSAYECPTRLYYLDRREYGSKNKENEFLQALAQGGFQVGALAKIYFPGGVDLEGVSTEDAIKQTDDLLKQDKVTIFEAAISTGGYLVRVDVLKKSGNFIELIEVKAKSYDFDGEGFFTKKGTIAAEWDPYLADVAFQVFVAKLAHPEWIIEPSLFLADKTATASVDGLHQRFLIEEKNGRSSVKTLAGTTLENVGDKLVRAVVVKAETDFIIDHDLLSGMPFKDYAELLLKHLTEGTKPPARLGSFCKKCEFRISKDSKDKGLLSGFEECWAAKIASKKSDFSQPLIFDLWDGRKTEDWLSENIVLMQELQEEDLAPKTKSKKAVSDSGLSRVDRQWLQVTKDRDHDPKPYFDKEGFKELHDSFKFPLHFIDFETSMSAIPFHKGRRPYEQLAFQFSHHVMKDDGSLEHVDQFLHADRGEFPNSKFLRALKRSLSTDRGTIFRYADHENTVLRQILTQLRATPTEDFSELEAFVLDITSPPADDVKAGAPVGPRNMVDLRRVVLKYFYHPLMGGSNSIKKVIPAVLHESEFVKNKYSKPIYGAVNGIKSLNFKDWTWFELDLAGKVIDPYKKLPKIFEGVDTDIFDEDSGLFKSEDLKDGGAAMTAWARMQFTEMGDIERERIKAALLKYCELDTLSMAMIMEYFISLT